MSTNLLAAGMKGPTWSHIYVHEEGQFHRLYAGYTLGGRTLC